MDRIDRALIGLAQRDGRGSYSGYGERVGLSAAAVHDRLKKLVRSGAIRNWSAVIDTAKAGYPALAFVRVQIDLPANAKAFARVLSARPEIMECHQTGGEWSCLLKVRAASPGAIDAIVAKHVATQPGVIRLQSEAVTATEKETHILTPPMDD